MQTPTTEGVRSTENELPKSGTANEVATTKVRKDNRPNPYADKIDSAKFENERRERLLEADNWIPDTAADFRANWTESMVKRYSKGILDTAAACNLVEEDNRS